MRSECERVSAQRSIQEELRTLRNSGGNETFRTPRNDLSRGPLHNAPRIQGICPNALVAFTIAHKYSPSPGDIYEPRPELPCARRNKHATEARFWLILIGRVAYPRKRERKHADYRILPTIRK